MNEYGFFIEREESILGDHEPGSADWVRYAGPYKTEQDAQAYFKAAKCPETYRIVEVKR